MIVHEAGDKVKAIQADLLIEGNKIVKIEQGIAEPTGTEVIDCQDKIISPGSFPREVFWLYTLITIRVHRHSSSCLADTVERASCRSQLDRVYADR